MTRTRFRLRVCCSWWVACFMVRAFWGVVMDATEWEKGDPILVRGEVLAYNKGVGVCVELFSKSDQYHAWVREDLVAARGSVVLDPADREQVDRLCAALVEAMHAAGDRYSAANGVHPATVVAALDSLTKPPRIPEPGLWGVVNEASGRTFMRDNLTAKRAWLHLGTSNHFAWDEIDDDPTLIREGVES